MMSVIEAKELKLKLENDILDLIKKFQDKTTLRVEGLHLNRLDISNIDKSEDYLQSIIAVVYFNGR